MSKPKYNLSKVLIGHSSDVRSLAVTQGNDIISGSRDKTAKYWKCNDLQGNYQDVMTYQDQKHYVASVVYLKPCESFPDGLVITGGNDHVILLYKPYEPFATFKVKEHTNVVSCLSAGTEANTFLSGSWDTTAKLWCISGKVHCKITFTGHTAAIWSVIQIHDSRIATASADKTVCLWNTNGDCLQKLIGHTDCVRCLADFPELNIFASVANDASVKLWNYSGENVNTYYGHSSFIYSIARCKVNGENCFVTSGEDKTVQIWEDGVSIQTITLPAQSVWSVICLENGDIVTGSSDGVIRIFTRDESRFADEATMAKFNEDVNASNKQSMQEIGGVKVSDLPGKEALYNPGKRAGQMKMIRESHGVVAYTWVDDGASSHWEKVGDVLGGTDKDDSGKTIFEGKAYDYVFSVDVEDGKPPLKLPYNVGDDVYKTAQSFLDRNFLPAAYLEEVVSFILKNTKEQFVPATNNEYQDPFTGGSRYTPSYRKPEQTNEPSLDPFTGECSYTSSELRKQCEKSNNDKQVSSANYFPISKYHTFDIGDPKVILNKLREFHEMCGGSPNAIQSSDLEEIVQLCSESATNENSIELLSKLFEWPESCMFPVIDVVRMAVRHSKNNELIARFRDGILIETLLKYIGGSCKIANNTVVALRTICNLCAHEPGENLVHRNYINILENITSLSQQNRNTQIALSTVLLNLTILMVKRNDEVGLLALAGAISDMVTTFSDAEAHFRSYVAIGTLVSSSHKTKILPKINNNKNFLSTLELHCLESSNDLERKRMNCANQLKSIIQLM